MCYALVVVLLIRKMGKILSKIFGNKEMRILMLGLDAAGKTSKIKLFYVITDMVYIYTHLFCNHSNIV